MVTLTPSCLHSLPSDIVVLSLFCSAGGHDSQRYPARFLNVNWGSDIDIHLPASISFPPHRGRKKRKGEREKFSSSSTLSYTSYYIDINPTNPTSPAQLNPHLSQRRVLSAARFVFLNPSEPPFTVCCRQVRNIRLASVCAREYTGSAIWIGSKSGSATRISTTTPPKPREIPTFRLGETK